MNLTQLLKVLKGDSQFINNVTHWKEIPEREADYAKFPNHIHDAITEAYVRRGIRKPYTHQRAAMDELYKGKNVVIVTPTASGKTLCYNMPVLNSIIDDEASRALYLFPTKALSADQVSELYEIIQEAEVDIKTYTYDGDTPAAARKAIRQAGHIVVTNPDMLHSGILPHHTKWVKLFENIKYVVIDEIHTYRGVFGSHLANVIRRLKRIMEFYGSSPQFICCSATIANPGELASAIIEDDVVVIDENGAPSGKRNFIFYNPPVVNQQLGIRASSVLQTRRIATSFIRNGISTIVFGRSRLTVEVLVNYLKRLVEDTLGRSNAIAGYRGGYLPTQRRAIERGLRNGNILGVVSTNALELGVDIGSIEACVMCGYPGTISSTWQQSGRAGRRNGESVTVLVADSSPLSQFIIRHPEYFFGSPPEHGLINADNLFILINHIKCAAFELPFKDGDKYGKEHVVEILEYLEEQDVLRHVGDTWYWANDEYPSSDISLRAATNDNFVIIEQTDKMHPKVIGEMDRFTVPMLLHEEAVYLQQGRQFQVEKLDFEEKKAYVRSVNVDYYTDADLSVSLKVLDQFGEKGAIIQKSMGEVMVTSLVTMFKKIKFDTHENLGWGKVKLPELEMHTTSYWMSIEKEIFEQYEKETFQNAMLGISYIVGNIAPVYLMCQSSDISVVFQVRSTYTALPTIFIYDNIPGGIGFSQKLFDADREIYEKAIEMIDECSCLDGCPSCVGPGNSDKKAAKKILEVIVRDSKS